MARRYHKGNFDTLAKENEWNGMRRPLNHQPYTACIKDYAKNTNETIGRKR